MKINYRRKQWKYRIPIGGPTLVENSKRAYDRLKEKEIQRKMNSEFVGSSIGQEDGIFLEEGLTLDKH